MYDDNPLCDWLCPTCEQHNQDWAQDDIWACERETCDWEFNSQLFYRDDEQTDPEYNWYVYRGSRSTTPELSDDGEGGEDGDDE